MHWIRRAACSTPAPARIEPVQACLALLEPARRLNHKALPTPALTADCPGGSFRLARANTATFNLGLQTAASSFSCRCDLMLHTRAGLWWAHSNAWSSVSVWAAARPSGRVHRVCISVPSVGPGQLTVHKVHTDPDKIRRYEDTKRRSAKAASERDDEPDNETHRTREKSARPPLSTSP